MPGRIIAAALHIPGPLVRVSKPRIGGGFGAKQTAVCEVYPAFVTWKTKKPSKLGVYPGREPDGVLSPARDWGRAARPPGVLMKDGTIRGIDLYTLSNTGAYGEHGPTTVGSVRSQIHPSVWQGGSLPLYQWTSVYTNHMSSGAYRGYGATQGLFRSRVRCERAGRLRWGWTPLIFGPKNITHEGERMPA